MPNTPVSIHDRQRGCFIGLAIGDALGAAVEFESPGTFRPVTNYRDGGPHGLAAGEWTDDTSMALALAHSIIQSGWNLSDQLNRYVDWWQNGTYSVTGECFDIGIATQSALRRFLETNDPYNSADTDEYSSGNGSIMRIAPVAIRYRSLYPNNIARLSQLAVESSLTTHASPQCLSACRYMTLILAGLLSGEPRETVLSAEWPPLRKLIELEPLHPLIHEVAQGSFRSRQPPEIQGTGWVVKSLEASLWAFHTCTSFEEAVLKAVNLGDDSDTTGAICGQFAGAYWGYDAIPKHLKDHLACPELLNNPLTQLIALPDQS